ncbi:FtsK/SpoIIIE domain-containing protein [Streptomyces sp. YU58]|uniref:FtsK/SpoIIIE domain-containing protein n=1 Tax=Streptomyces sp. SX92 TaxID=3158972 RepID=UPI0027B8BD79|nr:FtsK/SpoIIIE domain-containing protein [Streptomyces coralus]WLW54606.1 FHA domain-containing protein [Streptomyces coralus]
MQIRLTVIDPLGPPDPASGRAASCDVLVTAPAGTALAAVASALASAVSGAGTSRAGESERGGGQVVFYAAEERLDTQRCTLGEPPLIDGAVLSLGTPGEPEAHPELDDAPTQLHVIAGPDAGGVHLLHGGQIHIGRSADADVPLDDPDVSRLHCAVTVGADGRVSVADLDSTNGTTLDGVRVGTRPVRFAPGALLRIGESALRLAPTGGPGARVHTAPDGEGHVRVETAPEGEGGEVGEATGATPTSTAAGGPSGRTHHTYGTANWGTSAATSDAQGHRPAAAPLVVPGQGGAPRIEARGARPAVPRQGSGTGPDDSGATHAGRFGVPGTTASRPPSPENPTGTRGSLPDAPPSTDGTRGQTPDGSSPTAPRGRTHVDPSAPYSRGQRPSDPAGPDPRGPSYDASSPTGLRGQTPDSTSPTAPRGRTHSDSTAPHSRDQRPSDPAGTDPRGRTHGDPSATDPRGQSHGGSSATDPQRQRPGGPAGTDPRGPSYDASAPSGLRGQAPGSPSRADSRGGTHSDPSATDPRGQSPNGPAAAAPRGQTHGDSSAPYSRGQRPGDPSGTDPRGPAYGAPSPTAPRGRNSDGSPTDSAPGRPSDGPSSTAPRGQAPGNPTPADPRGRTHGDAPSATPRGQAPGGPAGTDPHGPAHGSPSATDPRGQALGTPSSADTRERTYGGPTATDRRGQTHGAPSATTPRGQTHGDPSATDPQGRAPAGPSPTTPRGQAPGAPAADDPRGQAPSDPAQRDPRGQDPSAPSGRDPREAGRADGDAVSAEGSRRKGTPLRGTDVPQGVRKRGGLSAWARRLTGGRGEREPADGGTYEEKTGSSALDEEATAPPAAPTQAPETWPDPAALLLTALGPGPRLWERAPGHEEALTVRLGTADRAAPDGSGLLPAVPVTADLREAGALGLAGPRARLAGLARAVVAQLTALHSPDALEVVLISTDRSRSLQERTAEWSWLGWLPHVRPGHGQDCRLLLAYDREQATARTDELLRRLEDHLTDAGGAAGPARRTASTSRPPARRPSWARDADGEDLTGGFTGPYTVVVVDGDPGGAAVREAVARLALEGPRAGIHVVCLAETAPASPASPVTETYEAACAAVPAFRECGAVALLSGDVATALRLMRVARTGTEHTGAAGAAGAATAHTPRSGPVGDGPVGHGTVAAVDAVSLAWAERFARALAPLRAEGTAGERHTRVSAPLPQAARLLDELGLARATPASLMARWADAADDTESLGGRAWAVLGAGPRGPVCADLATEGPHLLIEGPSGSGRTELLRALVASLAAAERPDRLSVVLIDGRDSVGTDGGGHGEGLRVCTDVPHVTTHLTANDPVRMREFAQSLSAELKRRAELLGRSDFAEWHTGREVSGRMVTQRTTAARGHSTGEGTGDLDTPPSSTIRLRPAAARRRTETAPPLPRLVVVVDDLDALVSPALGSPGRPAAGSVIRALEAVARDGERLGVHLVAAATAGGRTAESEPAKRAALRVTLDAPTPGPDEPAPGRGRLSWADGRTTPFQGGRVTGRIPRTATLRPTVVPLEWDRMGDPPARRPVRELGNGPTDLALLASALERAAREVSAAEVPSLL